MRKQPKSVAFFATSTGVGGMERLMAGLARQMTRRGVEAGVWLASTERAQTAADWLNAQGVRAQCDTGVMNAHQANGGRAIPAFRGLIRRTGADIVNLHSGVAHISLKEVVAVRLAGRPCVATVHAMTPWSECGNGAREATRRAAPLCRAIIAHTNAVRANLLDAGVAASKIHVVPCGLPLPASRITRDEARRQLNLPPDAFVIVTAARLVEGKGIDDLIQAVAQMNAPRAPDASARPVCLLIAGDGPQRPAFESMAQCLPDLDARFVGYCEDLSCVYASGDVFALPSHAEGFGLVFIEAAMRGLPGVGTRVGGIPEAVLEGETGLLAPVRDIAGLADALSRLRDDTALRRKLASAAQSRARSQFSEDVMAERYLQALCA